MAHVKRLLEAKFARELQRAKKPGQIVELDEQTRDRQQMLRLIIA